MSSYNELQEQASSLGMPIVVGKSKEELLSFISKKSQAIKPDYNAAIVFDGNVEIRRYTLDIHGKEFADLASSFISKHDTYTIKLVKIEPPITCPSCGHKFEL